MRCWALERRCPQGEAGSVFFSLFSLPSSLSGLSSSAEQSLDGSPALGALELLPVAADRISFKGKKTLTKAV